MLISVLVAGCADTRPPTSPAVGIPEFQRWSQRALSQPAANEDYARFSRAYHGGSAALRKYFAQAYQLAMNPLMDPANEEWLIWTLETMLYRFGDHPFATIIRTEPPRVQSAVSRFLPDYIRWSSYPETKRVLDNAPAIDFPQDKTRRKN